MDNLGETGLLKGWVTTTLGDVCLETQYGWTTSAKAEGTLHLLRTTDINSGKINWDSVPFCEKEPTDKEKYLLIDGDIVVSRAKRPFDGLADRCLFLRAGVVARSGPGAELAGPVDRPAFPRSQYLFVRVCGSTFCAGHCL